VSNRKWPVAVCFDCTFVLGVVQVDLVSTQVLALQKGIFGIRFMSRAAFPVGATATAAVVAGDRDRRPGETCWSLSSSSGPTSSWSGGILHRVTDTWPARTTIPHAIDHWSSSSFRRQLQQEEMRHFRSVFLYFLEMMTACARGQTCQIGT
jgi:hypothetical protein